MEAKDLQPQIIRYLICGFLAHAAKKRNKSKHGKLDFWRTFYESDSESQLSICQITKDLNVLLSLSNCENLLRKNV